MPLTVDCFITLWLAVTDFDDLKGICLSPCLLAYLSVFLPLSLSICLPACLSIHLSVICPSIRPPACLPVFPSICRSACRPSIHLSAWLPIFPSIHLSVCLSVHLSLCSQLFNHSLEHNLAINRFPEFALF